MAPIVMKKADLDGLISRQVEGILAGMKLDEMVREQVAKALENVPTTDYASRFTARSGEAGGGRELDEAKRRGIFAAQFIRAIGHEHLTKGRTSAQAFAAKTYGADSRIARALSAGDFAAGGATVHGEVYESIIELLRPASAVRRLGPQVLGMNKGTLTIPKLTGGATATYTQENSNITNTEQTFGDLVLMEKKLAAQVVLSNDWLQESVPGADALVRDDTVAAISQRSDLAFIRGDGTQNTPRGLRYLCPSANLVASQATPDLAKVTTDFGNLILAVRDDETRMLNMGWIWAPRTTIYLMTIRDGNGNYAFREEMLQGRFWGWPFADTTQIPVNLSLVAGGGDADHSEIYLADFADVIIGEASGIRLDMSSDAAYHDGSAVQAAFSKDQTVMRAIVKHDIGLRHDGSVAVMYNVEF